MQQYEQHKSFVSEAQQTHRLTLYIQVLNVHLQHGGLRSVVSGSKAGDLLWWDFRFAGAAVRSETVITFLCL